MLCINVTSMNYPQLNLIESSARRPWFQLPESHSKFIILFWKFVWKFMYEKLRFYDINPNKINGQES